MHEFGTDKGREGVQNTENLADVIYVWPQLHNIPRSGSASMSLSKSAVFIATISTCHLVFQFIRVICSAPPLRRP